MKKLSFILIFSWLLLCVACQPEAFDAWVDEEDPDTLEYVELSAGLVESPVFAGTEEVDTKASLSDGVELKRSGALLLVYRHENGVLDSYRWFTASEVQAIQAGTQTYTVSAPKTSVDVYLLGNLVAIRKSDGAAVSLMEALGASFPVMETGTNGLEILNYRLDGGDINSAYRRETMAEALSTYGLPYLRVEKDVNLGGTNPPAQIPQGQATWLFSKVNLTIDHSLFDGGDAGKVGYFVNNSVHLHQANVRLTPFSTAAVKAEESADLSSASNPADYDAAMSNAGAGTYVFYIPENMQGAQAGITMEGKNKTNTAIDASRRNYGTYVEFSGTLSGAGGFSGDVTYQFYLGGNATTDFNLERGKKYDVTLGFTAGALFGDPVWKVNPSITDSRLFRLTADAAFTTDIGDVNASRMLAVRQNRPGKAYVYMNTAGSLGSLNALLGKAVERPSDFVMSDMADCAWYSAFMTSGTTDAQWLADRGITPAWDNTTAALSFTVTDATKFASHLGDERTFTLSLLPGGTSTATVTVKLFADISATVAGGLSLTEDFYIGQKRTVSVSGFSGSSVKYAAVQEGCGEPSKTNAVKTSNRQWKTVNTGTLDGGFPTCAVDAGGNPVFVPSNSVYTSQSYSGSLDVYAWYPNRFQSSHSGWTSKDGKIVFFSEDWLNDSCEVTVRVSEPQMVMWSTTEKRRKWNEGVSSKDYVGTQYVPLYLNVDGGEKALGPVYKTFNGSADLAAASFDATLYSLLLPFGFEKGDEVSSAKAWYLDCIGMDTDGDTYIRNTLVGFNDIFLADFDHGGTPLRTAKGQTTLGSIVLKSISPTRLYDGVTKTVWVAATRPVIGAPSVENMSTTNFLGYVYKNTSNDRYECDYFNACMDNATGANVDPSFMFKYAFTDLDGDLSRLDCSYSSDRELTFTASDGTVVRTVIDFGFDDDIFYWKFDPDNQVTWVGAEAVPGEMLVPVGTHTVTVECSNKWDSRSLDVTSEPVVLHYNVPYNGRIFVGKNSWDNIYVYSASPRGMKCLIERGIYMSHAGREYCRKVCGEDVYQKMMWRQRYGDKGPGTSEQPLAMRHADANGVVPYKEPYYGPSGTYGIFGPLVPGSIGAVFGWDGYFSSPTMSISETFLRNYAFTDRLVSGTTYFPRYSFPGDDSISGTVSDSGTSLRFVKSGTVDDVETNFNEYAATFGEKYGWSTLFSRAIYGMPSGVTCGFNSVNCHTVDALVRCVLWFTGSQEW